MHGTIAGWHLICDALVAPEHADVLSDVPYLDTMFRDLVQLLGMEILVEPAFRSVPLDPAKLESGSDEGGVTGTAVITTSHLSIHTWPLRQRFSLDVYSCKQFSQEVVVDFLKERLHVVQRSTSWIIRTWP